MSRVFSCLVVNLKCRSLSWSFPSARAVFQSSVTLSVLPVRYAGHSHWKNIKHTKEAKDAERQKVTLNVMQRIRVAVREAGGTNPKINTNLARVMDEGKARDVPLNTMTELLRKLDKSKEVKGSQTFIEAKGINNCMLMIETYSDRPKWVRQAVQHVLKQYGGTIGDAGTSSHCFTLKGVVYVQKDEAKPMTKDETLEAAIEAGAEDIVDGYDDYDRPAYQFICDPKETHSVKKALSSNGMQCMTARQEYIAHNYTRLDETTLQIAGDMLDDIESLDEVVRVFDNIDSTTNQTTS